MSKKNQKRKKEMQEKQGCPRPWRQIDDTVVDAHGRIVKAPHGCSWEGDNYNDGAAAAQIIVEAVNSQQSQPVPEGFVLFPASLTNDMIRAFAISTVGRWDSTTEAEKQEVAEKLQSAFDEMRAAAPKPGGES